MVGKKIHNFNIYTWIFLVFCSVFLFIFYYRNIYKISNSELDIDQWIDINNKESSLLGNNNIEYEEFKPFKIWVN